MHPCSTWVLVIWIFLRRPYPRAEAWCLLIAYWLLTSGARFCWTCYLMISRTSMICCRQTFRASVPTGLASSLSRAVSQVLRSPPSRRCLQCTFWADTSCLRYNLLLWRPWMLALPLNLSSFSHRNHSRRHSESANLPWCYSYIFLLLNFII